MVIGGALAEHFNTAGVLQARQFVHQEILFGAVHVTIIDVECQAGRVRRRINEYCGPVESAQHVLVLFRPDQRAHRQRAIELVVIGLGYFFEQLQSLRSERAKQIHPERLAII
ncbi:MAG: hypothetical protein DME33_00080 [Verrucomicrobia bacterium]|nr:MAG: hypothetical protein DME33_00080 [Verrucomicrobiota bacterium]